jgi:hypothetical protein
MTLQLTATYRAKSHLGAPALTEELPLFRGGKVLVGLLIDRIEDGGLR